MPEPLGYLITWTCYGTWLPGDARRSVDRAHNAYGFPRSPVNPGRAAGARRRMTHQAVLLTPAARALVDQSIRDHCALRDWDLQAINVRSNHVHVVVAYPGLKPEPIMGQLKSWCSRRLHETAMLPRTGQVWTDHGSTGYLWRPEQVAGAVAYVAEGQDPERFGNHNV